MTIELLFLMFIANVVFFLYLKMIKLNILNMIGIDVPVNFQTTYHDCFPFLRSLLRRYPYVHMETVFAPLIRCIPHLRTRETRKCFIDILHA